MGVGWVIIKPAQLFGGIAQLARAHGSYPWCHWFKSSCRYQGAQLQKPAPIAAFGGARPVGQAVKTPPFHGGNTGSSPVRVTKNENPKKLFLWGFLFFCIYHFAFFALHLLLCIYYYAFITMHLLHCLYIIKPIDEINR